MLSQKDSRLEYSRKRPAQCQSVARVAACIARSHCLLRVYSWTFKLAACIVLLPP